MSKGNTSRGRNGISTLAVALAVLAQPLPARAADIAIVPETRLRMQVIQWMPVEGEYRKMEAMGGDLVVAPDGTLSVPVVGTVETSGKDTAEIAADIAERLRAEMGLIDAPQVGIDVIEYPPVYVVGAVAAPGQFPYRPGFTVLQALALGGGQLRPESASEAGNGIRLRAELAASEHDIIRTLARCARLRAQISGAESIEFPDEVTARQETPAVREIMQQEQALLDTQADAVARQASSFDALVTLLTAEIAALEERGDALDANLQSLQAELGGVSGLVEQGLATVSRRTDIERLVSSTRAERLDQTTAILRSRQGISEAERNRDEIRDRLRTAAAEELLARESELEDLYLQRELSRQLLAELATRSPLATVDDTRGEPLLEFSIVRAGTTGLAETPADEFTALLPGDVLKVTLSTGSFRVGERNP